MAQTVDRDTDLLKDAERRGIAALIEEARTEERARACAILRKYREQSKDVEPPELRERILLTFGLACGEITNG